MQRIDVYVTTPEGVCPTILITPDGDGPFAPVILFTDAGGVRAAMVEMAERLADMGYATVLAGDVLPRRSVRAVRPEERVRRRRRTGSALLAHGQDHHRSGGERLGAFLEFLDTQPGIDASRIGTTGYCMGGRVSLTAASRHPDQVVAAASFHGGYLVTDAPDSPHRNLGGIFGRVYVAGAQDDGSFTDEHAAALDAALTEAGVDHRRVLSGTPRLRGARQPDVRRARRRAPLDRPRRVVRRRTVLTATLTTGNGHDTATVTTPQRSSAPSTPVPGARGP